MFKIDVIALQIRIETMLPTLNEYQRRRYLATEAKTIGHCGVSLVSRLSGVTRKTIINGIKELNNPNTTIPQIGKSRKKGGGRKNIYNTQPDNTKRPKRPCRPSHQKRPHAPHALDQQKPAQPRKRPKQTRLQCLLPRSRNHAKKTWVMACKLTKKPLTVEPSHPDRAAQFEYLNAQTLKATATGIPVLSIDAKKKEKLGNFKNNGRTYQKFKTPLEVLDHDFPLEALGKATPFGVYDIFKNRGFVNVGLSAETAVFVVESLRRWWYVEGILEYAGATK
jgi:hypothetical protein